MAESAGSVPAHAQREAGDHQPSAAGAGDRLPHTFVIPRTHERAVDDLLVRE
jgi:hypothetical protein